MALLNTAPHGFSCPSGHTTTSLAAATSLFLYHKKWGAVALVMAGLVAFSRMYFFVHYLTDVLFGVVLGIACALAARWIVQKIRTATGRKEQM
ncbi:MAG: phosphatase PAP2 family protein [Clostridia bacterium]|nr:phosphatase PAP2 family protein [Clostridia bacterium]